MVQIARPNTDVTPGSWTTQSGGATNLAGAINEATADDANYVQSSASPVTADIYKVLLDTTLTDPLSSIGHHVRYRFKKSVASGDQINLTVRLVQGTSVEIANWVHTDIGTTYTDADQTLTSGQADAITDYGNLRLWFEAVKGGWTPLSLPNLLAWYEGDNITQSDGTGVSSWTDTSGNARPATQATGGLQPLYKTAILNGKPVIRVDATDDYLQTASIAHGIGTGDFTLSAVFKTPASFSGVRGIACNGSTTDVFIAVSDNGATVNFQFYLNGGVNFTTQLAYGTWYTVLVKRVGTTVTAYVNGTADATTPTRSDNVPNDPFTVGARGDGALTLGSDIAALVWMNAAISDADRASLQSFWQTKYAHY